MIFTEKLRYNNGSIDISYIKFGNGDKNLIILPGLSIRSVLNSAYAIEKQYSLLKNDYTVYLIDRNVNAKQGYLIKDMAVDTAEVIKSTGIKQADIIGVSQGGVIAQIIAVLYPELVNKLVITSSTYKLKNNPVLNEWLKYTENNDIENLVKSCIYNIYTDDFYKKNINIILHLYSNLTEDELSKFYIYCSADEGLDLEKHISDIKCPTLIVGAENDRVFTKEEFEYMQKKLNCKMILFPLPYRHAVYDESEDFLIKVYEFLKSE